jgi:3-hydroxyacyl-[acyl-carrier-protein] dehydratase
MPIQPNFRVPLAMPVHSQIPHFVSDIKVSLMRWFWVDRFVEFESGKRARSIKNVSLAEEHMHDHFPGFPVMPGTLMIEGMAQTGGILLGEITGFSHMVALAKIPKAVFHRYIAPGETIHYDVTMLQHDADGGIVECMAYVADELVAETEIMYAYVDKINPDLVKNIDIKNFFADAGLSNLLNLGQHGYK